MTSPGEMHYCKERGCETPLSFIPMYEVLIQNGCASITTAFRCPKCGRLHWDDGVPALSRRNHQKCFYTKHGVEQRPLDTADQFSMVYKLMESAVEPEDIELVVESLDYVIGCGHTHDCPARHGDPACRCGIREAKHFIENHPPIIHRIVVH